MYATSYYWLTVTLAVSLTVSEIWPVFIERMHTFPTPVIQPPIWKCSIGIDCWNFACPSFAHIANYSCIKSPIWLLARVHPLQTDRQTDGQTTIVRTARPLFKYGQLKRKPELIVKLDANISMNCRASKWNRMPRTLSCFLRAKAGTATARLSYRNSVCPSVRPPSHGWIRQKRSKLGSPIFTIGCLEDSSFRNRKAFS